MEEAFDLIVDSEGTGWWPTCYPLLESLNSSGIDLHHYEYGLRHPFGAYSQTLLRVEEAFISALNSFDELCARGTLDPAVDDLIEKYRSLYYALAEHFEACEGAAKSLVPKGGEKKHPKLIPFLRKKKTYQHVDLVINQVKHRHNELVPLAFRAKFLTIYGFVVYGIRSATSVGPNLDVHKQWHGPRGNRSIETAFSFNRDFRHLFVDVFRVGALLADTLVLFGISQPPGPPRGGSRLFDIASRIARISDFCFPDEREQLSYSVDVTEGESVPKFRVRYGEPYRFPAFLLAPARVQYLFTLGAEPSVVVPYYMEGA